MCFHFLYALQVDTVYQKVLYNSCFCFYVMKFKTTKEHILHNWGFIVFYSEKIISV